MINAAVKLLFPGHEFTPGSEVNGLSKGTVLQNCKILAQGQQNRITGRREFYLVEVNDVLVFLRVCDASPGSGYDEFAVIRSWEPLGTSDAEEMKTYALESISILCE